MSWALFLDATGRPAVDWYAFARLGRIVSEHPTKPEADEALRLYRERAEREEAARRGQGSLFP